MSDSKTLTQMTKSELILRAEELMLIAEGLQDELRTALAAKAPASVAVDSDGVVMVVHLGGVEWNGTERKIIRCAPTGPLSEAWMVQIGNRLVLNDAKGSIPARPYHQLQPAIQKRAQWSKAAAIKAAASS